MEDVESLFINANRAIEEKKLSDAKNILEEILIIEPIYGRAHNYLAWIYETEIKDYQKAIFHYKLAVKFSGKDNPLSYINYIYLLLELQLYKEIPQLLKEAEMYGLINPAVLNYQHGRFYEAQNSWIKTLKYYKKAKLNSFDNLFFDFIEGEIKRVHRKLTFLERIYTKLF